MEKKLEKSKIKLFLLSFIFVIFRHISTKLQQMLKRETIIRPASINSINLNKSTNIMDHYVFLFETGMIVWRQHRAIKYKQGWKY